MQNTKAGWGGGGAAAAAGGGEWGAGVCGEGGSARVDEWESAGLRDV